MNTPATGMRPGELIHGLGTAVLFLVVALSLLYFGYYVMSRIGIDSTLHRYNDIRTYDPETGAYSVVPLRPGIELVALPLAAIAAAWLRWGAEAIAAARAARIGPLLPLLGAGVVSGVIAYLWWFWSNPQDLLGIHPQAGVQRWIGVALVAGVGYLGMILFPRLTAAMAGAFAGPALFAIVGYILFPSLMQDPEGRVGDALVVSFLWAGHAVALTAIPAMLLSERLRQRPLGHAVWVGVLMLFLAVGGTFSGSYE